MKHPVAALLFPLVVAACASTADAGPWRSTSAQLTWTGDHSPVREHVWRFAWETGETPRAVVELDELLRDPERDDPVLARVPLPGLALEPTGEIVWSGQGMRVICARVAADFWSGYRPEVRPTDACRLRRDPEVVWEDTPTGRERRVEERVTLEIRGAPSVRPVTTR
ncbi:MAG: hypothetical protein R3E98_17660 [Gemmatimonadota bacterium]